MSQQRLVITGFGPFRDITENPSDLIAKKLKDLPFNGIHEVIVKTMTLVVHIGVNSSTANVISLEKQAYCKGYTAFDVNGWKHSIFLSLLHSTRIEILFKYLVQLAETPYMVLSHLMLGKVPEDNIAVKEEQLSRCTSIDLHTVIEDSLRDLGRDKPDLLKIQVSEDPGRYLCGFSYYLSLCQDCDRSLFIHVPPLNEKAAITIPSLTTVVHSIIQHILLKLSDV